MRASSLPICDVRISSVLDAYTLCSRHCLSDGIFSVSQFKAPFDAYEFANFHKQAGSEVILFSSAWCNAHPDDTLETKMKEPDVGATIDYWGMRLFPLLGTDVTFVVADRVGSESCEPLGRPGSIIFCGGSCFIQLKQGELVGELDYHEEAVLVRDIALSIKPRLSHAQEAVTV